MRFLKVLRTIALLVILGGGAYYFREYWPFFLKSPCREPILYNLGAFDERFGISREDFIKDLKSAEEIWEKPTGRDLFVYTPDKSYYNVLKINLVYDYRQEVTGKLSSLGEVVEDNQESYDALRTEFEELKREYEKAKSSFRARASLFAAREQKYKDEVEYWNDKGGAPPEDYQRLEAERKKLESEAKALDSLEARVNKMADELNQSVVVLNRMARTLNISVDKYNNVSGERGEAFEEGVYQSEGWKREINIYEFEGREKLIRVLAHELGHALYLDHVEDPEAIMYEFNEGEKLEASSADLTELEKICKADN